MAKLILSIFLLLGLHTVLFAQKKDTTKAKIHTIKDYKGKVYIFDANQQITACNDTGLTNPSSVNITAKQGSRFKVVHVDYKTGDLTISFFIWTLNKKDSIAYQISLQNRSDYNFKSKPKLNLYSITRQNDNVKYFLLRREDMDNSCSDFIRGQNWEVNFGTFTTPFKFRLTKSVWAPNLNLGTSVSIQYKLSTNWSVGTVVGLSLSSVSLDSASTNNKVKTSTDRPAFTPSLHLLVSYKNINITLGSGIDYINRPSPIEQAWIYYGKPWLGFGIGVNLFSNGTPAKTTKAIN